MRATKLQELEEMVTKLLTTASELPPGQDRHNALRKVSKFRVRKCSATIWGVLIIGS
jgi:hypothetical protein